MEIDVAALRKRLNLTADELATKIGADPVTIWRWEGGKRKPRGYYRKALAELLAKSHKNGKRK